MFNVDYSFNGEVEYKSYYDIVNKIMKFKNWQVLGNDESGLYKLFGVVVGNPNNPAIFINGAVHGHEYHVIEPIIDTLKMIEDGRHPDKELNNKILKNFCIVSIPMANPYGMTRRNPNHDRGVYGSRYNANDADLNRNFGEFLQSEQRIIRDFFNKYKPFAFADFHMFHPTWGQVTEGKYVAVNDVHKEMESYMFDWINALENITGIPCEVYKYEPAPGSTNLIRGYFAGKENPYTPKTISLLMEHIRQEVVDDIFIERLNNKQLYNVISLNVTFYLKYAIKYFEEYADHNKISQNNNDYISEIRTDHKNMKVFRNLIGQALRIEEEYDDMIIDTEIIRDNQHRVSKIVRKKQ